MNPKLQEILNIIKQNGNLSDEQKKSALKALKDADKEIEITAFKLERTEKVKKTTAILLEETIEELEQKRKAVEEQNRELEIEASLERVRTVAMSMNKSDDLLKICETTFKELQKLGFNNLRNAIIHILNDEKRFFMDYDYSDYLGGSINSISYNSHPIVENYLKQIKKADDAFAEVVIEGDELDGWKEFRRKGGQLDDPRLDEISSLHYYLYSIGVGDIGISAFKPIDDSRIKILKRFRNVFDLAYRTYTDITKAEEQARESHIQLALERVRARTMAMHKSEELSETAEVLFEQFNLLGKIPDRMSIGIINEKTKKVELWVTDQSGNQLSHEFFFSLDEPTSIAKIYNAWKQGSDSIIVDLTGQNLKDWLQFVKENAKLPIDETKIKGRRIQQVAFFSKGFLILTTHEPVAPEIMHLLVRFAKVFDQTYRRFLDLQKAEAQAREAQIEAALERVRSKTMAMHNSQDVGDTVVTLFDEVLKLGLDPSIRCGIGILEGNTGMETWSATSYPNGKIDLKTGMLDMTIHPMLIGLKKAWENGEKGYSYEFIGNDIIKYYTALNNEPDYPFYVDIDTLSEKEYHNSFFFSEGILFAFTKNPMSEESAKVLNRFAGVFGQTYRRYLDLKKAEAQAREAQIEAALERVRTNAMAMQNSDDLAKIVEIVFTELKKVGFQTLRCGIGIIESTETKKVDIWSTTLTDDDLSIQIAGDEVLEGHPLLDGIIEHWVKQTDFSYIIEGNDFEKYYKTIAKTNFNIPEYSQKKKNISDERQYYYMVPCKAGGLYAFSIVPFTDEVKKLMRRFIEVFQLAYTRYEDLKKAETQNKIIQAENDRKTKELEEARELQLSMLPEELPELSNLDIAVYMQTATEVGGDYYDFHVAEDGTLTAVLGDATGHGMKAGTMVTITKSLFDTFAASEDIISTFNRISSVIKGLKFRQISMCLLMLKLNGNKLKMSSAAMPPALIYRKKKKTIEEIFMKGMPLGAMNNFLYELQETMVEKGDTILLMSDGLPELSNDNEEMYGYERIKTEFQLVGENEPEEIVNHLKNSASKWVNGKDPDDDVTFVVLKMK